MPKPQKEYLQFKVAEATKEKVTIVASDETLDRYGEVVPLDAWDLRNYKNNPVLLVDHDYKISNIVGRAKNLKVANNALTFEPEFHDITPLAREVARMVEEGFAPAVSVGFLPHGPKKDGDRGSNELLEISFVAVGANPNALALAMKSIDAKQERQVFNWSQEKNAEALELQRIEFSQKQFEDEQSVKSWLTNHDFKSDDVVASGESWVAKQFDLKACGEDVTEVKFSDDGVVGYACRPKKVQDEAPDGTKKELIEQVAALTGEIAHLKEGRVLSGKTRSKIEDCVTALKQAATALDDLLEATDPSSGKAADTSNGREPVVEAGQKAAKPKSDVLRVLQRINKDTNLVLSQLKK